MSDLTERDRIYIFFVVLAGLLLSIVHLYHATTNYDKPYSVLLSDGIPLILSLSIVVGGYWLLNSETHTKHAQSIAVWVSLGMVGMFSMALLIIANQQVHDKSMVDPEIIITNMIAVGAIAGLLIGIYDSRSISRSEELETEREKFEVVNRILRHDIRNSMSVTIARIEILKDRVEPELEEHIESIHDNTNYVIDLTKTVRQVMKAISSGDRPELEPIDLVDTLEKEVEKAQKAYEKAEFELKNDVPKTEVKANEMLSSVFTNLFNNAVHHNNKDESRVEIDVEERDGEVVVSVSDNGPGVPDEQKDGIFGRGEKGLESEGTGIGLYLVDTLVSQYGGEVWVKDNEPEGSVFKVRLKKADTF